MISTGPATYSYSDVIEPKDTDDYDENYVVLLDANGKKIKSWTVSDTMDVSASGITTPTGTLEYYSDSSMDEELGSNAVSFKAE